jgi:hypothetical protein
MYRFVPKLVQLMHHVDVGNGNWDLFVWHLNYLHCS